MNISKNALSMSIDSLSLSKPILMSSVLYDIDKKITNFTKPLVYVGLKTGNNLTIKSLLFKPDFELSIENILASFYTCNSDCLSNIIHSKNIVVAHDELYIIDHNKGQMFFENALITPLNTILFYIENEEWFVLSGFPDAKTNKPTRIRDFYLEFYRKYYPIAIVNAVNVSKEFLRVYSVTENCDSETFHLEPIEISSCSQHNIDVLVPF
ncbi:hypothetical protein A7M79_01340 [Acinetobacter baumannii]|uniref:hypothetical protein n=1 Tax=Acinetobacter baumannii TaxID=470 RepID=UPI0008DDEC41|nr:hypothetical protein [Acinetobacter baumannii]OIH12160.1 hypothetical protein A7M79_01340 [Acinetobacter baumannii]